MPFEKGQGGRRKGVPNKLTAEVKERLQEVIEMNIDELKKVHSRLTPAERISFVNSTLKYIIPTLRQVDTTIDFVGELESQISEMTREDLINIAHILKRGIDEKDN